MKRASNYNRQQIIYGGDKDFSSLCDELEQHNKNKHYLSLSDYQVSFEQLKIILQILETHPYIKKVNLASNDIDDLGATIIARLLLNNNVINCFILNENPITEIGAKAILHSLQHNKCLVKISLIGCETGLDCQKKIDSKLENNALLAKKIANFLFDKFQDFNQTIKLEYCKGFIVYYHQIDKTLIEKILIEKFVHKLKINKSKKIDYVQKDFATIKNNCKEGSNSKEIWLAVDQYNNTDQLTFEAKNLAMNIIDNFKKCIISNYFLIFKLCKDICNNKTSSLSVLPMEVILEIMSYLKPEDVIFKAHQNVKLSEKYLLAESFNSSQLHQMTNYHNLVEASLIIGDVKTASPIIYEY